MCEAKVRLLPEGGTVGECLVGGEKGGNLTLPKQQASRSKAQVVTQAHRPM